MQYQILTVGDKLQNNDEYSTGHDIWRGVPSFMQGDIISSPSEKSNTLWRRPIADTKEQPRKRWFQLLK